MDNIIVPTMVIVSLALFVLWNQQKDKSSSIKKPMYKKHPPAGVKVFSTGHVLHDPMAGKDHHRGMMNLVSVTSNNRLRGLGDPIRGDLPIPPRTEGLYVPYAKPEHTLRLGAVNIFPGNASQRYEKLKELITPS